MYGREHAPGSTRRIALNADGRTAACRRAKHITRLATSVRQVTRDQMELGPTGSDTGRSCFLLSPGCDRGRYYRVTHGTGLIPNETLFPCLVACLHINRTLCTRGWAGRGGGGTKNGPIVKFHFLPPWSLWSAGQGGPGGGGPPMVVGRSNVRLPQYPQYHRCAPPPNDTHA